VSSRPIKILVVDDEPMIRNFLRTGLRYEGFEVAEAGDGSEALAMASTFRPDLVILDVMMPRLDGHEVARRLRGDADLGILMLTARDEVSDRIQGLDLGADDYLVKPFDFDELLSRLRAILRRLRPTWGQNLEAGPVRLDLALHQAFLSGRPLELTAREFDLLKLFVQHPKQALSRQTILDRVWGGDFFGGENNVEVYVGYLRRKLGARARLIQTVRGVGYRFVT
jgi:two-component system response regulator MprA